MTFFRNLKSLKIFFESHGLNPAFFILEQHYKSPGTPSKNIMFGIVLSISS